MENYHAVHVNDVVTDWSYALVWFLFPCFLVVPPANPSNFSHCKCFSSRICAQPLYTTIFKCAASLNTKITQLITLLLLLQTGTNFSEFVINAKLTLSPLKPSYDGHSSGNFQKFAVLHAVGTSTCALSCSFTWYIFNMLPRGTLRTVM